MTTQAPARTEDVVAFRIDGEAYGVGITDVREIRAWTGATRLPNTAPFMRGVMNLRGAVVPIVDLRVRFGRPAREPTAIHVVIVVAIGERWVGLLVDGVSDIVSIDADTIQSAPPGDAEHLLRGIATVDDQMIALLDLSALLSNAVREAA
jgi:purine-binding chemotaxis protein CheW